ncbi:hypothetical protein Tco_1066225 [Tanacetum coccineum]|uniref:Uncharacterized protein n=1 Tax=Tanacetum coccineum TaxID=301880 RepID=A0ABQ5H9V8_9ASTR
MLNPKDVTDPTTTINIALVLMAKASKLNYSTPTNNNQRILSNPGNRQIAHPGMNLGQDRLMRMDGVNGGISLDIQNPSVQNVGNQNGLIVVQGIANQNVNLNGNGNVVATRAEGNGNRNNRNQTQLMIAHKEEAGIQLQAEEFDLMADAGDLGEIEEVNANYILMANLQQTSTSGTQTDNAPVYYSDGSAEVHHSNNCYDNDIFNIFTQEEHVEQSGRIVEQTHGTIKETCAYFESLYNNLAIEINALHLSSAKTITALNEEIANLNKQVSKEKSTVSFLQEERKRLKSDFKTREDALLDEQIQLENKQAQQKQQSLYNGKVLLEKHDPPVVYDSEETLQPAQEKADESLAKHKALDFEIERLLKAVVNQDIMSIVQSNSVVDTSNLQTELNRTKEKLETCIIKKEKEYGVLWNNCSIGKLKGKSKDTPCVSDTLDPLSQKLKDENVALEF